MKCKDHLLSHEIFELKKHTKYKELLCTTPLPDLEDLGRYYESDDYISHSDEAKGLMDKIYYFVKKRNLKFKLDIVHKSNHNKKTLDYGCGTGAFAAYLNENQFDAYGFEPNEKAKKLAQEKIGKNKILNHSELKNHQFDVITLWHVLEHIPNLFDEIEFLKSILNQNGKLIIAVPNYKSYDAQFYQNFWAAYDVPRHLWHFSPKAIQNIFADFGMILEKEYPMIFDAFYVSMLSEKYKQNSLGIFRAFFIGLFSNLKAQKSGQFSSKIYQFKRK